MENGEKTIREMFIVERIFTIPDFQRSYSWDEKQLDDFMDDLNNQNLDKKYFFGTFLFEESQVLNDYEYLSIVDGQQRITTLIIFMKCLIDNLRERHIENEGTINQLNRKYIIEDIYGLPKLQTTSLDDTFFHTYILKDSDHYPEPKTPSQRRLLVAKDYFQRKLQNLSYDELNALRQKVESASLLTYSVQGVSEATLIFEMTNDRGKRLTSLESIKSYLMHKMYLCSEHPEYKIKLIQDQFGDIYKVCEALEGYIKEDDVLRHHFIAFEQWENDGYSNTKQSIKDLINKIYSEDKGRTVVHIEKFSKELKETFEIVQDLVQNVKEIEYLDDLFCLGRLANFYPLLIKTYKLDKSEDKYEFSRIIRLLEIFSFKAYGIAGKKSNAGLTRFFGLARDFSGKFSGLEDALRAMLSWWNIPNDFDHNLHNPNIYHSISKNDLNYLFWKYENFLRAEKEQYSKMPKETFLSNDSKVKITIEHIASRNPKEEPSQISTLMSDKFKEYYLHSIGNLAIAPKSENSSMQNKSFTEKDLGYFSRAPIMCQNELNNFLHNGIWDDISIQSRGEKIIKFALQYWDEKSILI